MKDDARRCGLNISIARARHFLKHPIDDAHMEVHMLVQAGAEAVDEGHGTDVQGRLVHLCNTGAVVRKKIRSTMFSTAPSRCIK